MNTPQDSNTEEKRKHDELSPLSLLFRRHGPFIWIGLLILIIVLMATGIVRAVLQARDSSITNAELALSLKPAAQLVALQVKNAKIGIKVDMEIGLCRFGADYMNNATFEAGIDLANFSEANINYDEKSKIYRVSLPAPQLTRCAFDKTRYAQRQYASCGGLDYGNSGGLDQIAAYVTDRRMIEEVLQKDGILERSKRETVMIMQQLIKALTGKNAEITFQNPPSEAVLPPSCDMASPPGWQQDAAGVWKPT